MSGNLGHSKSTMRLSDNLKKTNWGRYILFLLSLGENINQRGYFTL